MAVFSGKQTSMHEAQDKRVMRKLEVEKALRENLPQNVLDSVRTDVLVTSKGLTKVIVRAKIETGRDGGGAGIAG